MGIIPKSPGSSGRDDADSTTAEDNGIDWAVQAFGRGIFFFPSSAVPSAELHDA